ncbi:MAG TPA: regulatory protein RecX, partial [Dongiaceae bacterium]|nr:regulatory protein RecX [Dongiaceae bacterium]
MSTNSDSSNPGSAKPGSLEKPGSSRDQIRQQALQLLSRREHSLHELQQKLAGEHAEEDLTAVLTQLVDAGLQSDRRFADVWVRHRSQQGFGPIRIRGELRQKGIASD